MQQRCTIGGGGGFEDSERISHWHFDMVVSGLTDDANTMPAGKVQVHVATSGVWMKQTDNRQPDHARLAGAEVKDHGKGRPSSCPTVRQCVAPVQPYRKGAVPSVKRTLRFPVAL